MMGREKLRIQVIGGGATEPLKCAKAKGVCIDGKVPRHRRRIEKGMLNLSNGIAERAAKRESKKQTF